MTCAFPPRPAPARSARGTAHIPKPDCRYIYGTLPRPKDKSNNRSKCYKNDNVVEDIGAILIAL